jgi:hypothetical protein
MEAYERKQHATPSCRSAMKKRRRSWPAERRHLELRLRDKSPRGRRAIIPVKRGEARQAVAHGEALAKGTADGHKVIETILADKVRELV